MAITYKLAEVALSATYNPAMEIRTEGGQDRFKVEIYMDGPFSDAQVSACLFGASVAISHSIVGGSIIYTGTVEGFNRRKGYSRVSVKGATCEYVPDEEA
jgi:hypothetical protein